MGGGGKYFSEYTVPDWLPFPMVVNHFDYRFVIGHVLCQATIQWKQIHIYLFHILKYLEIQV